MLPRETIMEDLETNPLYNAFLSKFKREFDIACKMSYLIVIPHSDSLDNFAIDQFLANSHILMPSKLLKMHYTPIQTGYSEDIEELDDGNKLVVYVGKKRQNAERFVVNILAQDIGYNVNNREFRTLLIDRPLFQLDFVMKITPLQRILSPLSSPKLNNRQRLTRSSIKPPKPLTNHDNCIKYLEFISQDITMDLEAEVKKLQSRYMILSHYLNDAASRIKALAEAFVPRYKVQLANLNGMGNSGSIFGNVVNNYDIICDSLGRSISLAVENYIVHLLHGKLVVSLYQQHEREERILMRKFDIIQQNRLTICQLGAQSAFSDFLLTEEIKQEFKSLPAYQSPLSMVNSLMRIVELITESLNESVKFKDQFGFNQYPEFNSVFNSNNIDNKVSICSDDLIASFVYSLAYTKPAYLYSCSKYLETFGFSSNATDQAAYYTATFQIVIQYILNFRPDDQSKQNHRLDCKLTEKHKSHCLDKCNHLTSFQEATSTAKVVKSLPQESNFHQVFISNSLDSCESTSTE